MPSRGPAWYVLVLGLACASACDPGEDTDEPEGDSDADSDADTDSDSDADSDLAASRGRLGIYEVDEQAHDRLYAQVDTHFGPLDKPWDEGIVGDWILRCDDSTGDIGVWRMVAQAGDCIMAVLGRCDGTCAEPCDWGEYCDNGGTCVPTPVFADSGDLSVGGLPAPLELSPTEYGYSGAVDLPAELFDPGDVVTLTTTGGTLPAIAARASGVASVDVALRCDEVPAPGQDYTLTWTPSGDPAARIRWDMEQDVHLAQGPRIRCESADTGSLSVPAALIDAYLYGQLHRLTFTRTTEEAVALPGGGTYHFEVGSRATCTVNEGHTPW